MWECKYGKEPLDTRLCFLRLIRKSWLVVVMALIGAAIFGIVYFMCTVVYGPAREYVTESEFYVEYVNAVTQEQQYTYYNQATWNTLAHKDVFMDEVMAGVEEQTTSWDRDITREEVEKAIYATLLTDVRIVHVKITTNSPELTMIITDSLESAFIEFGESQLEIDTIRPIILPKEAALATVDDDTLRVCILGAVIFAVFTLFFMYLYAVLDTSIYIPLEFERRYGIPMMCDDTVNSAEEAVTESVYFREQSDGTIVLYVKSKDHNGPLVEQTIRQLMADNKNIAKAVLTHADYKLIKWYFKTGKIV